MDELITQGRAVKSVGPNEHIIHNGQPIHKFQVLEGPRNARLDDLGGLIGGQRDHIVIPIPVKDLASRGLIKLGDTVEYGGLASAVGADQAEDLPLLDVEGKTVHRLDSGKVHLQIPDAENVTLAKGIFMLLAGSL